MTAQLLNNRYRIVGALGAGGFGNTFLAEDTHMPSGRRCVLKQLKPVQNEPAVYQIVQERFQREAAILEELGDANNQIPRLYAYFELAGQFYLVQEWIKGVTLSHKVQQEGLQSESSVKEILVGLLPVLDYVHNRGIIHRDIKPDNVILRQADSKPVLIDFGAVKETVQTVLTTSGNSVRSIVIGTPGFMPGEQSAGRPVYSSDLYSLGLTAIYLLTGKLPQALPTDHTTGNILWRRDALSVSPGFAAVLDKAVQSHPRDRYSTAKEMLDALQMEASPLAATLHFAAPRTPPTQPITASPEPTEVSSPPSVPNNTVPSSQGNGSQPVILGSVITGGLIGASVIIGLMVTRTPQPSPVPTLAEKTASPTIASVASSPDTISESPQGRKTPDPPPTTSKPTASPNLAAVNPTLSSPSPTPVNVLPQTTKSQANDYSWLSTRAVTQADLDGKDGRELDIMRNSIYARQGRMFRTPELQSYFDSQPWYTPVFRPDNFNYNDFLSPLEIRNGKFISDYQDRTGRRWIPK